MALQSPSFFTSTSTATLHVVVYKLTATLLLILLLCVCSSFLTTITASVLPDHACMLLQSIAGLEQMNACPRLNAP